MSRKDELKAIALQQRIGELTSQYESILADLRVSLTIVSEEKDALEKEVQGYRDSNADTKSPGS